MLAQIVLTPAESKKLIAKAVARLEAVQKAASKGIVALHPRTDLWTRGRHLLPRASSPYGHQ